MMRDLLFVAAFQELMAKQSRVSGTEWVAETVRHACDIAEAAEKALGEAQPSDGQRLLYDERTFALASEES